MEHNKVNALEEAETYMKMRRDKINEGVSGKVYVAFLLSAGRERGLIGVFGSLKSAKAKCSAWLTDSFHDTVNTVKVFEIKSENIKDERNSGYWGEPGKLVATINWEASESSAKGKKRVKTKSILPDVDSDGNSVRDPS